MTEMRSQADWHPEIVYWVEDGKPDPQVDWPENWEVCGWPDYDPLAFRHRDKERRHGHTCLAMPMYSVNDPVEELQHICCFLEQMPEAELSKWLALQDRQLTIAFSDPEVDAGDMEHQGFHIPGPLIRRLRALRLRLMIGFHPASDVITQVVY